MNKGIIFDIRRFSVHDGPGIRTTVFFKGCPLSCWWCHNPESRSALPESSTRKLPLDGRHYCSEEIIGNELTVSEVLESILKDRIFFEESGGGATLSGGEPLFQPAFARDLLKAITGEGIHTAVDTCGLVQREDLEQVIPFTDLFLFDLKLMDEQEHMEYTGVSNRLIHENLKFIIEQGTDVAIRFPVIPGITDTKGNIELLVLFLKKHRKGISRIHLLPFHSGASSKYERLGMENKAKDLKAVNKNNLEPLQRKLSEAGFQVIIGGSSGSI